MNSKPTHGGKRVGAGRKPRPISNKLEQVKIYLTTDAKIRADLLRCEKSRSAYIEQLIWDAPVP